MTFLSHNVFLELVVIFARYIYEKWLSSFGGLYKLNWNFELSSNPHSPEMTHVTKFISE